MSGINLNDIIKTPGGLISSLCDKRIMFSQLTLEQKLLIKDSRPMPELRLSRTQTNQKQVRNFQTKWYSVHTWLTGCSKMMHMFCFPCLLFFPNSDNRWVKGGLGEECLQNFSLEVKRHTATQQHFASVVRLAELGKNRIDHSLSKQMREDALKHNEKVKKNRTILERLVQSTCFLAKQELAFRGHNEKQDSDNKGNYLELLDLLASHESVMKEHLESDTVFKGTSAIIQNELIESASEVLNDHILEEIRKSRFLSIQADETTDVSTKAQLSVIVRYVNNDTCEVLERFMGFYDVSADKTAAGVSNVLLNLLEKWEIPPDKLICQTYDGASVMAGQHGGVHTIIRQRYPHALFIHCYAHQLNLILLHGSKTIKEVKLFIANVTLFHTFFSRSSRRSQLLRDRGFKLPHPCETRWNYNSRGVATIKEHYFELHAALQDVINDENGDWDPNSIALASSVLRILTNPKFVYFIHFYSMIFLHTDMLYDILQKKASDVDFCITQIKICKLNFLNLRSTGNFFQTCIERASQFLNRVNGTENAATEIYSQIEANLRRVSYEILDSMTTQMDVRFNDFEQLSFASLLNFKNEFSVEAVDSLMLNYPFFDRERLINELTFIHSTPGTHWRVDPQLLLKYIIKNELDTIVPELTKLLQLLLTIPTTTASCERSMSALKRIKTYLRSTMTNLRLSHLGILAIEKKFVKDNSRDQKFIDRVIDVFANKKDRKIDLIYSHV